MNDIEARAATIVEELRGPALLAAIFALLGTLAGRGAARSQTRREGLSVFAIMLGLLSGGAFAITAAAELIDRALRGGAS
jgi:hypothetical protein